MSDHVRRPIKNMGLRRDKDDEKRHKHCRDNLVGLCTYHGEWFQPMPYFFTREGNVVPLIGNWRGGTAFLICGGPSFKDIDTDKLKDCFTMSINNSIRSYRTDLWMCVDDPGKFIASCWTSEKIMKVVPFDHAEKPLWDSRVVDGKQRWGPLGMYVGDCPNVIYFKRNSKFEKSRWLFESTLNWGNHKKWGGNRSVMLPAIRTLFLFGFRTVYLLGADFNMSKDVGYHFDQKCSEGTINGNQGTYKKMNEDYFPNLRKEFEKYNFHVFNCNPNSNLTAFDYVPFENAVNHATRMFGEIDKERTDGMYKTYNEKKKELTSQKATKKDSPENKED